MESPSVVGRRQQLRAWGKSAVRRFGPVVEWVKRRRVMRALQRFGREGGSVLTGGIAYSTLFSVVAALTIGWTAFVSVIGGNEELRQQVLDALDSWLPGLIDTGSGGVISPTDLETSTSLTAIGIVAVGVLLFSAMAAVRALRTGVRAMFAEPPTAGNAVLAHVRAFAGLLGMAFAIFISAALSIALSSAVDRLGELFGLGAWNGPLLRLGGLGVAAGVDMLVFVAVVVLLSGQHPPRRDLWSGALLATIGIGVVRHLGTSVVAGAADRNPLFASFAAIATLLVWINLISRIVLMSAAWIADPPFEENEEPDEVRTRA